MVLMKKCTVQARPHETVADHSDPSSFPPAVALCEMVIHEISCQEAGEGTSAFAAVTQAQVCWFPFINVFFSCKNFFPLCLVLCGVSKSHFGLF